MKTMCLLPASWKWPGLILSLAGLGLGAFTLFDDYEWKWLSLRVREEGKLFEPAVENFTNELALTMVLVGLLILVFSREHYEDERIQLIRLEAFQWSVLVHFIIVLVGNWALYGQNFFLLMTANLFTPLVVFMLRFYYVLYIRESKIAA